MVEVEQKITSSRKRDRVLSNFTPLWFSICMDTGILSILLHQLPYQFRGIRIISTIYFLLNIVLFVLFASIFLARIYRYGAEAKHDFGTNVDELMVLSCPIVGYSTLVAMTSMVTGQAWGSSWALFGYVMWWIAAFLSFSILFSSFYIRYGRRLRCVNPKLSQCFARQRGVGHNPSSYSRHSHRCHRGGPCDR